MTETDYIWAGIILVGGAFEAYTLRRAREGDTLSEATRALFRVQTSRIGRVVFLAGWLGFSGWFAGHIMNWW